MRTLDAHTAGDPMQESVKWTELTQQQIADKLAEKGFFLTRRIVKQLLDKHEYKKRKMHKTKTLGEVAQAGRTIQAHCQNEGSLFAK